MALTKRTYVDGETIITAQNLNDIQDEVIAHESNKVPITRTVNSKALSSNITLSASDVGAVPITRTVNSKALSSNITLTAADVSAVPTTRTVNSKALSSNITLSASDVGAVPTTRTVNSKALSSDITLTSGDIGYSSSTTYASGSVGEAVSDLNGAINDVEGQITDNIQTNLTAKKKYEIGECFVYDGNLYRATQVINNGSAITIGTNAVKTTLDTAITDNYAFGSIPLIAASGVSSSASFDRTGNMLSGVGYINVSTAVSSPDGNVGSVAQTIRKRQQFSCINISNHTAYVVYYNTNGNITAPEGLAVGYYRTVGTIII